MLINESNKFYLKKVFREYKLGLRNSIIFLVISVLSLFFSLILGLILFVLVMYGWFILFRGMKNEFVSVKNKFYPNGQSKLESKIISLVKGKKTIVYRSFYEGGEIKSSWREVNSIISNKKCFDINGQEITCE